LLAFLREVVFIRLKCHLRGKIPSNENVTEGTCQTRE
jgi:hypothetical protein